MQKNNIKTILFIIEIILCVIGTVFAGGLIILFGLVSGISYKYYTSENPPTYYGILILIASVCLIGLLIFSYFKNFNFKYYVTIRLFLTPILISISILVLLTGIIFVFSEQTYSNNYYLPENIAKREVSKKEENITLKSEINFDSKTQSLISPIDNKPIAEQSAGTQLYQTCDPKQEYIIEKNGNNFKIDKVDKGYTFDPDNYYRMRFNSIILTKEANIVAYKNKNEQKVNIESIFNSQFPVNIYTEL
jgi:hypothetical protein